MKILISSISGHDKTTTPHCIRVLERMGHEIVFVSTPNYSHGSVEETLADGFLPDTPLADLIQRYGVFDLFLYIEPGGLIPVGIENAPFPTACWISDVHQGVEQRKRLARFFDYVFLYHRNHLKYFSEHPATQIQWIPYACDLDLFYPRIVDKTYDIAFIGQIAITEERKRIFPVLQSKWKLNEQKYYFQNEIPDIYSKGKIVINLPIGDDLNFRTFEALSCGTLLLTRGMDNGMDLLFEENKHYVAFVDEQELLEKIEYYLNHDEERETIAAQGLEEIRRCHRLENRLETILAAVTGGLASGAPIRSMNQTGCDNQYAWLYEYWRMADPGLTLIKRAKSAKRSWMPLTFPVIRTMLRTIR
jgi:hypothetical protein